MVCKECLKNPVYVDQSGTKWCKQDYLRYFEKKVLKTIRKYNLIDKKDKVACAVSGGKDSMTILYIINKILKRRRQEVIAFSINEGISDYREIALDDAKKFCKENEIELKIFSFKDEFGFNLDDFVKKNKMNVCSVCGVIRRYLMNRVARRLKANVLVTGHNLDDEAQNLLMNQFKGNAEFSAKLGPISGLLKHGKFVKKVKPLYFMTEKEVALYAFLKKFPAKFVDCPYSKGAYRKDVAKVLNDLEFKYPGTKQGVVKSFLSVLPSLKKEFKEGKIGSCSICGEAAAKELCKVCELLEKEKNL